MLSEPGLIDVLKATWDILGPYVLLQKHTSEITSEDINLSKFILYEYCGPLEELGMNHFENLKINAKWYNHIIKKISYVKSTFVS